MIKYPIRLYFVYFMKIPVWGKCLGLHKTMPLVIKYIYPLKKSLKLFFFFISDTILFSYGALWPIILSTKLFDTKIYSNGNDTSIFLHDIYVLGLLSKSIWKKCKKKGIRWKMQEGNGYEKQLKLWTGLKKKKSWNSHYFSSSSYQYLF